MLFMQVYTVHSLLSTLCCERPFRITQAQLPYNGNKKVH